MKCPYCGSLNKEGAKFCKNCGNSLNQESLVYSNKFSSQINNNQVKFDSLNNNKNTLIICATVIICVIIVAVALVSMDFNKDSDTNTISNVTGNSVGSVNTQSVKSWKLVDSYSGSGTGIESYSVPAGKIKVKISAYPIKNYATNYLSVSSTTGDSVSVDWGSKSAVETRSDSMKFDSNGGDTISIDYYETVNWDVEVYQYS